MEGCGSFGDEYGGRREGATTGTGWRSEGRDEQKGGINR